MTAPQPLLYQQQTPTPRNGFGITALILGIIGVLFGLIPLTFFIAGPLGVIGLIFGVLGIARVRKHVATNKVMSIIGTILSVIALGLSVVGVIIINRAVDEVDEALDDFGSGDGDGAYDEETAGSPDNPLPAGSTAALGDWQITVTDVELDAWDTVEAENQFNEPPADGYQFVMATIEATYVGEETGDFWLDVDVSVHGSGGNAYDDHCGVIPDDITDAGETFPDASITGNFCVPVESAQLDGASWILEDVWDLANDARYFISVE